MNYYIRIEKDNELIKSGCFDLEINAIEYAFKLADKYRFDRPGEFTTFENLHNKLELLNFVHVWSLDNIKCMIIKK